MNDVFCEYSDDLWNPATWFYVKWELALWNLDQMYI